MRKREQIKIIYKKGELKMGKREQILKRLPYRNQNSKHVFVCFLKKSKLTEELDFLMRRHHVYFDYQRLECSVSTAEKHNRRYAWLMEYFTNAHMPELIKEGYDERRGDSTGVIITSSRKPMLVYSIGNFKYRGE